MFLTTTKLLASFIIVNLVKSPGSNLYGEAKKNREKENVDIRTLTKVRKYQEKQNVTFIEGEEAFLACDFRRDYWNPHYIEWKYGKDLESLEKINENRQELIYDYTWDKVSIDQAGFYTCKHEGGKRDGWKKLFHLTVKGKLFINTRSPRDHI